MIFSMQELHKELRWNQNILLLANTIKKCICFVCLFLFVCLFVCFFGFTYCIVNFLILKGIHSSKLLNLNRTGHFFFFFLHMNLLYAFALCCFNRKCSLLIFISLLVRKPVSPVLCVDNFIYLWMYRARW